ITEGKSQLLKLTRNWITPEDPLIAFNTKYNFSLKANLRDHKHLRLYFYGTHDERYEIKKYFKIIREGDTCWDIGANIGFYTCLFASIVGKQGKVIAFEPTSTTFNYLAENVRLNNFTNVKVINKALGDKREKRPIYYHRSDLAEETASLKYVIGDESETADVDTIDNVLGELPVPDFIKIDVEGYQMEVLRGGHHFFKEHHPIIMAELLDASDANRDCLRDIEVYLADLGYSIYEIKKHSLKKCDALSKAGRRNFLLVKDNSSDTRSISGLCIKP
ncbi:FkbM family methyltransferase, partial [Candidatus Poribacteria bacterium]|nr:FkbM family methyltransferase [Candidatus Poribacteria bacterium]